ncbi:hypothetical protein O9G_005940 [Rozella allomycis CSF55]|nr:hypothetical protein O9G_005940 [Rozella allomycis CSF55]|eukprot:EPZ36217.1 hypothetical protein O9G_005940 [Rozella allomycis CSF55]
MKEWNARKARLLAGDVVYRLQSWKNLESVENLAQTFQFNEAGQEQLFIETGISMEKERIGVGHPGKENPTMTWDELLSFIRLHYPIPNKKKKIMNFIGLVKRLSNLPRPFESWD